MSVRRRRIKERVERYRSWLQGHEALTLSLHGIQAAITAARGRGETEVTDRFLCEAFTATTASALETSVTPCCQLSEDTKGTEHDIDCDADVGGDCDHQFESTGNISPRQCVKCLAYEMRAELNR